MTSPSTMSWACTPAPTSSSFADYLTRELHARDEGGDVLSTGTRRVGCWPARSDRRARGREDGRLRRGQAAGQGIGASLDGRKLIVGIDRLDYSKGIIERLRAFEQLVRDDGKHRRSATLLQISAHRARRCRSTEHAALDRAAGRAHQRPLRRA